MRNYFQLAIPSKQFYGWLAKTTDETIASSGLVIDTHPPSTKNPSGKIGYIMNMSTRRKHRRKGVAKKIISEIIRWGKLLGIRHFALHPPRWGNHCMSH